MWIGLISGYKGNEFQDLELIQISLMNNMVEECSDKNFRLVMVMLVRNEQDILAQNIKFHLNLGVDFVYVINNNSTDGTQAILDGFEKQGVLKHRFEPGEDYAQNKWMSVAIREARDRFGADWVIPCDADEFWWPRCGDLKSAIRSVFRSSPTAVASIKCKRFNMLPDNPEKINKPFSPAHFTWRVFTPYPKPKSDKDLLELDQPWILYYVPHKVVVKTDQFHAISMGNHNSKSFDDGSSVSTEEICIYHYPIRSKQQFLSKIQNGAEGLSRIFHWERWYRSLKDGKLSDEFSTQILSVENIKSLRLRGIVRRDCTIKTFADNYFQRNIDAEAGLHYRSSFYEKHDRWREEYNIIAEFLFTELDFSNVIDFGCGISYFLSAFARKGISILGLDASHFAVEAADESVKSSILVRDLRFPLFVGGADLVICTEVAEHMEEEYAENLIDNISRASKKWLFFTAATPKQTGGTNHVNLQDHDYWYEKLDSRGLEVDWNKTQRLRMILSERIEYMHWFKENSTILRRKKGAYSIQDEGTAKNRKGLD